LCQQNNIINSELFKKITNLEKSALLIKPEFSIFFVNPQFFDHLNDSNTEKKATTKRKRLELANFFIEKLKNIFNISNGFLVKSPGIVGTSFENKTVEINDDTYDAISGVLFPKSDYYRVVFKNFKDANDHKIEEFISNDETVNFVLILSDSYDHINKIILRNNLTCPISGGFINDIYSIYNDKQTYNLVFISLMTKNSDNVRIAQVMIPKLGIGEKKNAEKIINQKFELLKKTKIYEHKQNRTFLAIQVSCIGKGKKYYVKENYESALFKKHFPDIKLVGFYSNGELGFDYLPNYSNITDSKSNNNQIQREFLEYTSIFTILSLKI